ncbi:MAG: tetratricopeptide repeat protein [Fidelibacterota bacterium]
MSKKFFLLFIIFIGLTSSCAYFNTFYNAETYFQEGLKDYRESLRKNDENYSQTNFNIAIEKSEKVLRNYPDSKWCDDAQYIIAVSNYYKKNYPKAKKEIEVFFDEFPDSELRPEMDMWYGKVFWKMGNPEMAVHHWQQLSKEVEDNELKADILFSIAQVYEEINEIDSAIAYYKKTTEVRGGSDKHGQAQYNIAELNLTKGRLEKAVEDIEKVNQFTITNDLKQEREILLLKIYRKAGKYEKAEKTIFKKLNSEKNKDFWDQLELELALIYRDTGDTSAALKRLKSIVENENYQKSEAAAGAYYYLGLMNLVDLHNYEEAAKNFKLVKGENQNSEFVYDAEQRINQLARYDKITQELNKNTPIVKNIIQGLTSPFEEEVETESDTADKSQEEIKGELEEKAKEIDLSKVDTLKTFEEYYENRYELAELYYFDFNFKDSAKYILKDIVESQYFNPFVEKSLYALYYIADLENSKESAEYYKNTLENLNPDSPYLMYIEEGKITYADPYAEEREKFETAEALIETSPDSAVILFKDLVNTEEEHPYRGKSAANIGWIMENVHYDLDNSLSWYKMVVDSFPESEAVQIAGQKAKMLQALYDQLNQPEEEDSLTAEQDTTGMSDGEIAAEADSTVVDSAAAKEDSSGQKPPPEKKEIEIEKERRDKIPKEKSFSKELLKEENKTNREEPQKIDPELREEIEENKDPENKTESTEEDEKDMPVKNLDK